MHFLHDSSAITIHKIFFFFFSEALDYFKSTLEFGRQSTFNFQIWMKDQDLNPCLHTFMEIIKSVERKQSNHCVCAHQAATRNRQPPTDDNINFSHGQQCCFPPPHKQKYTHIHSQKCIQT